MKTYKLDRDNIDLTKIDNISFDGIDYNDHPDYSDAFIESADYDGHKINDDDLEFIHDNYIDWIYEKLFNYLH